MASVAVTGAQILMQGGSFTTTGDQTFNGPIDLGVANTLTTTADGDITLNGDVTGVGQDLTLSTGSGTINVAGKVGFDPAGVLGDLTISSAGDVTFQDTLDVAGFIQNAGTGTTIFQKTSTPGAASALRETI